MQLKYSCVLFDLDGTLLNSNNLIIESFKHTLKVHLNLEVTQKEILQSFGEPLRVTLARYDAKKLDDMLTTYRLFNKENHDELATVFPGVSEIIKELTKYKIKLGVVTSKLRGSALKGIELAGISQYIETVVAYEDTTHHKPDPAPVMKALSQLKHGTEKAIMVGDSPFDWHSAKNAGIDNVAVGWSVHISTAQKDHSPDYIIKDFSELIKICIKTEVQHD